MAAELDSVRKVKMINIFLDASRIAQARALIKSGIQAEPGNIELKNCLTRTLIIEQKYFEAWAQAQEVLKVNPGHYGSRFYGITALRQTGRPKEALELAQEVLKDFPNSAQIHALIAVILRFNLKESQQKVEPYLKQALLLDPLNIMARALMFSIAHSRGDQNEMNAIIRDLQTRAPEKKTTALLLSEYISLMSPSDYKTIQGLISMYPDDPSLRTWAIRSKVLNLFFMRPYAWFRHGVFKLQLARHLRESRMRVGMVFTAILTTLIASTFLEIRDVSVGAILMLLFMVFFMMLLIYRFLYRFLIFFYSKVGL